LLLYLRDDPSHVKAMEAHGIGAIDLLVVNLYPFEATVAGGADFATRIENIDIGGPAMIRAAAKNHAYVAVCHRPGDYGKVLEALDAMTAQSRYALRPQARWRAAYARTAAYDAAVSSWYGRDHWAEAPRRRAFGGTLRRASALRREPAPEGGLLPDGEKRPGVATATQLQGKELSYNNINDTDAAFELVASSIPTARPAPSSSMPIRAAWRAAPAWPRPIAGRFDCDQTSAFGGIVALNRTLDAETATRSWRSSPRSSSPRTRPRKREIRLREEEEPAPPVTGGLPTHAARR
jgi:phosphoribosylaminoimidazolecarboxamide formyltransferase/IMP cyclohydrolase